ncbi:MAG: hypothetical protein HQK69_07645 [Desulfamplus sp.]|nr:hypothetical protein [Desulfamplus sp.]
MTDKPTYEELEQRVKKLEQENLELKNTLTIDAKKCIKVDIESEMIPEEHLNDVDLQSIINSDAIQSIMDDFHGSAKHVVMALKLLIYNYLFLKDMMYEL